jgi:hypothetical protein
LTTHTTTKRYPCRLCDMIFKQNHGLIRHTMKIHNQKKRKEHKEDVSSPQAARLDSSASERVPGEAAGQFK